MEEPDAQLINWPTLSPFAPIRQNIIDAYQRNRSPVAPTVGAYEITEYKRQESLTLKKNPSYFAADSVSISEVKIRFISDEGALVALLKAKTLDILNTVPVLQLEQVKNLATLKSFPVEAVIRFTVSVGKIQ